jgi:hypothetical protein
MMPGCDRSINLDESTKERKMRRLLLVPALALAIAVGTPRTGLAAGDPDHASCLGATASSVTPGTKDDAALYITVLAQALGTNHGGLVSTFAHETGLCTTLPPIPPHP